MRLIVPVALVACAFSASAHAYSTDSGYVTSVTVANSGFTSEYACQVQISDAPTDTTGTIYNVDDVAGSDAHCSLAMLAMYFDDALTVGYTTSGGYDWIIGFSNGRASSQVTRFKTGVFTGSGSPHHCSGEVTTTSGTVWIYVDDDNSEEHVTCATLAMLHFANGPSSSFDVDPVGGGEINTLEVSY